MGKSLLASANCYIYGKQDDNGGKQNSVDEGSKRETSAKQVKINISTFVLRKTLIQ